MCSPQLTAKIAKDIAQGMKSELLLGTIKSLSPLKVKCDQKREFINLTVPEHLQERKLIIDGKEYILHEKLKVGDMVSLVKLPNGYLLIDKVGDINEPIIIQ